MQGVKHATMTWNQIDGDDQGSTGMTGVARHHGLSLAELQNQSQPLTRLPSPLNSPS
jgi:hypothetical protein